MMTLMIDVLGWSGSLLLITAYYRNSRELIDAQSVSYQLMNVVGSILLVINTIYYGAYPSSAVNIIWVFIGAHFLTKITRKNAKEVH